MVPEEPRQECEHDVQSGDAVLAARLREAVLEMGRVHCLRDPLSSALSESLTPPQIHTVVTLGHETSLSMGELSRRLGASGPTMTGIVDRLERLSLVERQRDATDRRIVRLRLTEQGRTAHQQLESMLHSRLTLLMSLLDESDKQSLVGIIEKLATRAVAVAETLTRG